MYGSEVDGPGVRGCLNGVEEYMREREVRGRGGLDLTRNWESWRLS